MSYNNNLGFDPRKYVRRFIVAVAAVVLFMLSFKIFEQNTNGYYQVKQSISGNMSVRNAPGPYLQNLGELTTYKFSDDILLSSAPEDQQFADEPRIRVQFPDGWADVDLEIQFELSADEDIQLELHRVYSTYERVKTMIKQQVSEALKNTGSLFNSGDAYADKRSDFIRLAREQVENGLYIADVSTEQIVSADGSTRLEKRYSVRVDSNGTPVINKVSVLPTYDIKITRFNIKDMQFDEKLTALIEARKDAQKAQQDALTEKARGDTRIAQERANQEVEKIREVTIAEKNKEVAVLNAERDYEEARLAALTAEETARKTRAEGEAQAAANRALVSAGLDPLQRANIEKETAIGIAAEMAKIDFPEMMVFGGGNGSPTDPFSAVGLEAYMQIVRRLNQQ